MKKSVFLLSLLFIGFIVVFNTSCEEDPVESCEQEEFCDGEKSVTACCTEGSDCVYKYNGKEYPDTTEGLNQLVEDLDCNETKSVVIGGNNEYLKAKLQALLELARENSKR